MSAEMPLENTRPGLLRIRRQFSMEVTSAAQMTEIASIACRLPVAGCRLLLARAISQRPQAGPPAGTPPQLLTSNPPGTRRCPYRCPVRNSRSGSLYARGGCSRNCLGCLQRSGALLAPKARLVSAAKSANSGAKHCVGAGISMQLRTGRPADFPLLAGQNADS